MLISQKLVVLSESCWSLRLPNPEYHSGFFRGIRNTILFNLFCVIVSCDASNHEGAPMVTVCPLSSKLKDIPVHVQIKPNDVRGYRLKAISDFLPEDIQTVSKMAIRGKTGYIPVEAEVMEQIDRALIRQLNLIRAARNMVMEELSDGSEN